MNTLQSSLLENEISSSILIKEIITSLNNKPNLGNFPTEIHGFQGSITGFFLAEYVKTYKKDIFLVLPSEKEVIDLKTDLESTSFDGDILVLPWWGTVPYRAVAKGSVIFGQRASVLAKMATVSDKPRIFLIPQRSFMTPVPSPEYSKSNVFSLKIGQEFDSIKLSENLIKNGYIRVPRVTVRGEFALRGEVLDIFMPGEELAHRIVFDFDTIEQIKAFDSTIIDIAAKLAPSLHYDKNISAIKMSTLFNLTEATPEKVNIVKGTVNDRKCIDGFIDSNDCLYLFDRGYYNYSWYDELTRKGINFITRQVSNACIEELNSYYTGVDNLYDYNVFLGNDCGVQNQLLIFW